MELTYQSGEFIFLGDYEDRHIPKDAGFRWDPENKVWYTDEVDCAMRLRDIADPEAKKYMKPKDIRHLTYENGMFIWKGGYSTRMLPKEAQFRWDSANKHWWTDSRANAARLKDHADAKAKKQIAEHDKAVVESKATDADIDIPRPEGEDYLPFQKAGIAFALQRDATLIGDEMGLGKTIQAIGVINAKKSIKKVLIICPASLKVNWANELNKWVVRKMSVGVAYSQMFPDTDILVVNYDILVRSGEEGLREELKREWDLLVVDECQCVKNYKAKRTKATLGVRAKKKLFLTGTPILNRPIELWTVVNYLDPVQFKSWWYFVHRYCDAKDTAFGLDVKGASNLSELQDKLRSTIMIRRLKKEVLPELPAKRRQVIELPSSGMVGLVEAEKDAWKKHEVNLAELQARVDLAKASEDDDEYRRAVEELKEGAFAYFGELAKLRHATAVAKLPLVIEHIHNVVDSGDKVVVFAHHHDVVDGLMEALGDKAVALTGRTKQKERQQIVDSFQNQEEVRVFVGSIKAAGVGLTLTAASHVIFAELDWVPANISQAEDRCHRIGQQESVLIQHLVLEESLDANMAELLVEKQKVIDEALDNEIVMEELKIPVIPIDLSKKGKNKKSERKLCVEEAAGELTDIQVDAIHACLERLAAVCDGAIAEDHRGFNAYDTCIGHSLADEERLSKKQAALGKAVIKKYRRQLPEELYGIVF